MDNTDTTNAVLPDLRAALQAAVDAASAAYDDAIIRCERPSAGHTGTECFEALALRLAREALAAFDAAVLAAESYPLAAWTQAVIDHTGYAPCDIPVGVPDDLLAGHVLASHGDLRLVTFGPPDTEDEEGVACLWARVPGNFRVVSLVGAL